MFDAGKHRNGDDHQHSLDRLLGRLEAVAPNGTGWMARCPAHDDRNPSLSVTLGQNGGGLLHCFAGCTTDSVLAKLNLSMSDLMPAGDGVEVEGRSDRRRKIYPTPAAAAQAVARAAKQVVVADWQYKDALGEHAFSVYRLEPHGGGDKTFRPVSPCKGGWRLGDPPGQLPLYQLPTLLDADGRVFVVEGEKCADAVRELGLIATTSAHGSKCAKKADWSPLAGLDVIALPDHDEPGRAYASNVADQLLASDPATRVCIGELDGLSEGEDVVEWIAARRNAGASDSKIASELEGIAEQATPIRLTDTISHNPPDGETGRPNLVIGTDEIPVVDAALDALSRNARGLIYQRSGGLVQIARIPRDSRSGGIRRSVGTPLIRSLEHARLQELISLAAIWEWRNAKGDLIKCRPPEWIGRRILARPEWPFEQLDAITEVPILRPDGSVLAQAGYDSHLRTFFDPCGVGCSWSSAAGARRDRSRCRLRRGPTRSRA